MFGVVLIAHHSMTTTACDCSPPVAPVLLSELPSPAVMAQSRLPLVCVKDGIGTLLALGLKDAELRDFLPTPTTCSGGALCPFWIVTKQVAGAYAWHSSAPPWMNALCTAEAGGSIVGQLPPLARIYRIVDWSVIATNTPPAAVITPARHRWAVRLPGVRYSWLIDSVVDLRPFHIACSVGNPTVLALPATTRSQLTRAIDSMRPARAAMPWIAPIACTS